MTDQTKHNIDIVHTSNKAKAHELEKVKNELDDSIEALTIIDSAIKSTYLKDKHSLLLQEWAKEYRDDIKKCEMFIQEAND
tara:strand:+ start:3562 stop:3804 length:243 start_codon:yes stop_codon:yes gene_type:complete